MFRLSRKEKISGEITHSIDQESQVLTQEMDNDWSRWGD